MAEMRSSSAPVSPDNCSNLADQQLAIDIHRPIAIHRWREKPGGVVRKFGALGIVGCVVLR
jgi:hypothetical protein